jgi:hypothetical protein
MTELSKEFAKTVLGSHCLRPGRKFDQKWSKPVLNGLSWIIFIEFSKQIANTVLRFTANSPMGPHGLRQEGNVITCGPTQP